MRTYEITIIGTQPLLMHWDNIEWADQMAEWRENAENKKNSKAGDDRSPAHTWIGCVYNNGEHVVIPSDNLARCFMQGGTFVPVPGGRGGKTFKEQTQSGMMTVEAWPLLVDGKPIAYSEIDAMQAIPDFPSHMERARELGFSLFVKRAKIGNSKHIRVRPRFDRWSCCGTLSVWDDQITEKVLRAILDSAGRYKGLGDWRPGAKTPGPYGTFEAEIAEVK